MQQALAIYVTHKNYLEAFCESFIECVLKGLVRQSRRRMIPLPLSTLLSLKITFQICIFIPRKPGLYETLYPGLQGGTS